jgi:uncharacterized membrane protein YfcA
MVFLAGMAAGTINTVVGSGTLITFPVLLSLGLSPLTANVTNTLGLVPGSFMGAYGYRDRLRGQGGLALPEGAFKTIVPALIAVSLVLVVAGPTLNRRLAGRGRGPESTPSRPLWGATLGAGAYGGYFGAAQGVLLMGLLGALHGGDVQRNNAVKNILAGTANLVAAVVFVIVAQPDWWGVALVAAGSTIGGLIGARVGQRLPPGVLRALIVVVGVVAIVQLLAT